MGMVTPSIIRFVVCQRSLGRQIGRVVAAGFASCFLPVFPCPYRGLSFSLHTQADLACNVLPETSAFALFAVRP